MNTTFKVYVEKSFSANGIAVHLGRQTEHGLLVLKPVTIDWELATPSVSSEPAFYLDEEMARALMEALVKHFDFNLDTSTARRDYLYERGRVDVLTAAILDVLRQRI
jgi:hypothetical protein